MQTTLFFWKIQEEIKKKDFDKKNYLKVYRQLGNSKNVFKRAIKKS